MIVDCGLHVPRHLITEQASVSLLALYAGQQRFECATGASCLPSVKGRETSRKTDSERPAGAGVARDRDVLTSVNERPTPSGNPRVHGPFTMLVDNSIWRLCRS
jgi:hypothetical protein